MVGARGVVAIRFDEKPVGTLEATPVTLDARTISVESAADGAAEAKRLIEAASRNVDEGSASVSRADEAVNRIEDSRRGIAKITSVDDGTNFRTNLLGFNAGGEAARAGEAGRGFLVVASEVGASPQRSSQTAHEISEPIGASENEVHRGGRPGRSDRGALDRTFATRSLKRCATSRNRWF